MPSPTRTLPILLLLLLFLNGFAGSASAVGEQAGEIEGVRCTMRYHWPNNLSRGYFPVEVEVLNTNDEEVTVEIEAEQYWAEEDLIRRRVSLGAGDRIAFEMLLRARARGQNQYRITFEALGKDVQISGAGPSEYPHGSQQRVVLHAAAEGLDAGVAEAWTEEWTAARGKLSDLPGHAQLVVSGVTFDQLSPSWQAYTSVDSVVLDLRGGRPDRAEMSAILAWVRSGGELIVAGADHEQLRENESFLPILEERFKALPEGEHGRLLAHDLQAYRCGFGVVVVQRESSSTGDPMEKAEEGDSVAFAADSTVFPVSWTRNSFARQSRQTAALQALDTFENLPLRALMLLMIGFAILMGPVNFLWVKRMRKPMMILVTVPVIAFAASISLFLYGILAQGLDVKSITATWAILDQRTGQGTTVETRNVFAGSAPGEGMRPQESTLVFPESSYWRGSYQNEHLFKQDLDEGRLLSGDFFPIRVPVGQMIISDRTVRLRLDTRMEGDRVVVSNALGADAQELLMRTPDGEYHHLDERLREGDEVALSPGTSSAAKSVEWGEQLTWFWGPDATRLLPGTYIVRLDSSPSADDCGIEVNEVQGDHVLLGILEDQVESSR